MEIFAARKYYTITRGNSAGNPASWLAIYQENIFQVRKYWKIFLQRKLKWKNWVLKRSEITGRVDCFLSISSSIGIKHKFSKKAMP
jgi:hypothetical protein